MTPPPKREDRLNPMSRRKGRPPGRPPGAEIMVLSTTITCLTCDWQGLGMSEEDVLEMLRQHAAIKHPGLTPPFEMKEEQ